MSQCGFDHVFRQNRDSVGYQINGYLCASVQTAHVIIRLR